MEKNKYKLFIYTFIICSAAMACRSLANYFGGFAIGTVVSIIVFALFLADYLKQKDIGCDMFWVNIVFVGWNIINFFLIDIIGIAVGGGTNVWGAQASQTFASVWIAIYATLAMVLVCWFAFRMYLELTNKKIAWVEKLKGTNAKQPKKSKEEKNKIEVKRGTLVAKPAPKKVEKTPLEEQAELEVEKNEEE